QRFQIVYMDVVAFFDIAAGGPDGLAVFHDVFALADVAQGDLVAVGHVAVDGDLLPMAFFVADFHGGAVHDAVGKDGGHIVQVVHFQRQFAFHTVASLFFDGQHRHAVGDHDHFRVAAHHAVRHFQRLVGGGRGDHVGLAHHLMVQIVGHQDDPVLFQDAGEDLRAPHFGDGLFGRDLRQIGVDLVHRAPDDQFFKVGAAHAVAAGGAHDDDAAVPAAGLGGSHGLGALVQVLVQRVAAVGGDDDVAGDAGALGQAAHELHALKVRLFQVA